MHDKKEEDEGSLRPRIRLFMYVLEVSPLASRKSSPRNHPLQQQCKADRTQCDRISLQERLGGIKLPQGTDPRKAYILTLILIECVRVFGVGRLGCSPCCSLLQHEEVPQVETIEQIQKADFMH